MVGRVTLNGGVFIWPIFLFFLFLFFSSFNCPWPNLSNCRTFANPVSNFTHTHTHTQNRFETVSRNRLNRFKGKSDQRTNERLKWQRELWTSAAWLRVKVICVALHDVVAPPIHATTTPARSRTLWIMRWHSCCCSFYSRPYITFIIIIIIVIIGGAVDRRRRRRRRCCCCVRAWAWKRIGRKCLWMVRQLDPRGCHVTGRGLFAGEGRLKAPGFPVSFQVKLG